MKCKDCGREDCRKSSCPSINSIGHEGDIGVVGESLHSRLIGTPGSGKPYINVTEEVLTRFNPAFIRRKL
jgi:hypothetical protein